MSLEGVALQIGEIYNSILSAVPASFQNFVGIFVIAILIVIYSMFIWKLYRFIGTKNILELNLNKYNKTDHPFGNKLVAVALYFVEYIIILPFLVFFWFAAFTIFMIFMSELSLEAILLISVAVIAAIRMTSYLPNYGEDLAKEIAKLIPLTLLAVSILEPNFFDVERILGQFSQIGEFLSLILNYLIFIILLEVVLRFFEFLFALIGWEDAELKKRERED